MAPIAAIIPANTPMINPLPLNMGNTLNRSIAIMTTTVTINGIN